MEAKNATLGEKILTARKARKMSQTELAKQIGITPRALRYLENNERQAGVEVIKSLSTVLEVSIDYFMDDVAFFEQSQKEAFLNTAAEKYGSRGKAQANSLLQATSALFAGGELSEEDQNAFMEEMQELFMVAKQEAKIYTPKKYIKDSSES